MKLKSKNNCMEKILFSFKKSYLFWAIIFFVFASNYVFASGSAEGASGHNFSISFLWIAIILLVAKTSGLVEKFGQPPVLGELLVGVFLGNLHLLGVNVFEPIRSNEIISFLAELGVVVLLFQIGLESNLKQMLKVGVRAFLVACVGVVVPFVLGTYIIGPVLLPGLDFKVYLFLGAALTATSVGITARVFKDLNKLKTPEAQIVLGAAVIDDVLGLIILAVVSAIAKAGSVSVGSVGLIMAKALGFLFISIIVGQIIAPYLGKIFSKVHTGVGMKFTLAISFCLILSYIAQKIGLAPIVGAFAAGLVLDPVHFQYFNKPKIIDDIKHFISISGASEEDKEKTEQAIKHHANSHVEELIEPVAHFLVPIFFVMTGFAVKLDTLFDKSILIAALVITLAAFAGKVVSGIVAGKVNKLIVGFGMIPRGEVGLIFAMAGKSLGIISDEVFSMVVIMVILSTLLTPPILANLLKKQE